MQVTTERLEEIRQACETSRFPISSTTALALVEEIERLRADNARQRKALRGMDAAWNELPEGYWSAGDVDEWLNGPMVNSIRRVRAALEGK